MTIKRGIIGALTMMIGLLVTIGVISLLAVTKIGTGARSVEAEVAMTDALVDFDLLIRNATASAGRYAASEAIFDREGLDTAAAALERAAGVPSSGAVQRLVTLKTAGTSFAAEIRRVETLVDARRKHATAAGEAITDLEVLTTAVAEAATDPETTHAAVKLVSSLLAAGTSTTRFHLSRDPADSAAA